MPHGKIAQITGVPHVHLTKGSHFEHETHRTAGYVPGTDGYTEREVKSIYGKKI